MTDAHADTVDFDLPCLNCGYNLRSLQVSGRCPECGDAVSETFELDRMRKHGDWLLDAQRCARQMAVSFLIGSVTLVGAIVLGMLFGGDAFGCLAGVVLPACFIFYWVGGIFCLPNGMSLRTVHPFWIWSMRYMPWLALCSIVLGLLGIKLWGPAWAQMSLMSLAVWLVSIPQVIRGFGELADDGALCILAEVCFWVMMIIEVILLPTALIDWLWRHRSGDMIEFIYAMLAAVSMLIVPLHVIMLFRWSRTIMSRRSVIRANHEAGSPQSTGAQAPSHGAIGRYDDPS